MGLSFIANGQIQSAEIKVYGLTCSLCTRSVEKSLEKLSFINEINADLETTAISLTFRDGIEVIPEEIGDAVKKAGFTTGYILLKYNFDKDFNGCYEGNKEAFTVVGDQKDIAAGVHQLLIVEKDMMSNKVFKDYKGKIPAPCKSSKRHYYVALADQLPN